MGAQLDHIGSAVCFFGDFSGVDKGVRIALSYGKRLYRKEIQPAMVFESQGLPGLQVVRETIGLTQVSLAILIGMTRGMVSKIEAVSTNPSLGTVRKCALALHCSESDLLAVPTPERLAEIRAAYTRKVADEAELTSPNPRRASPCGKGNAL